MAPMGVFFRFRSFPALWVFVFWAVFHGGAVAEPESASAPADYATSAYRLGPGDVLSIQIYGRPDLTRPEVTVAPDGTVSFLSAEAVPVNGLTIEETRKALAKALEGSFRNPSLVVTPLRLLSKSYTVMGMVKMSGIFPMTQPVTLLEALARAGGTISGLFDRRYVDLADLDRSFIIRDGQRLPVNFRKLMIEGDMTQNVAVAPGDFILVASALANDYFVLGAVRKPGREGFTEGASVMAAIAKRLGFQDTAFRERVLVVRGSMGDPQVFVVNTDAILKGRRADFPLEPKDVVYVSNRPWYKVEEVFDAAVSVFLQSAVATWTGANTPVLFRNAILPVTPYNPEPPR